MKKIFSLFWGLILAGCFSMIISCAPSSGYYGYSIHYQSNWHRYPHYRYHHYRPPVRPPHHRPPHNRPPHNRPPNRPPHKPGRPVQLPSR